MTEDDAFLLVASLGGMVLLVGAPAVILAVAAFAVIRLCADTSALEESRKALGMIDVAGEHDRLSESVSAVNVCFEDERIAVRMRGQLGK